MFSKNLVQRIKNYPAGVHKFYTYGTGSNDIPLSQLVRQTPYEIMTIYTSNVGIGTTLPQVSLDILSTDAIQLPSGSNNQRPTGQQGYLRYNSELDQFEGFGAGDDNWRALVGLKNVAADTYIIADYAPGSDDKGMHFYTAGKERLIITSNGSVGIGIDHVNYTVYSYDGSNLTSNQINYPRQLLDITSNMIVQGNIGIGTLQPLAPLHVEEGAIFMNGNVGIGTTISRATLDVVGTIYTPEFSVDDIFTSNLSLSGEYIVLNAGTEQTNQLQMEPVYLTTQIYDTSRTEYTLEYSGLYRIVPEYTDVYINGYKMAYKTSTQKDYDVRYSYDEFIPKSFFTVILNSTVEYGDVLHVVFWPLYLEDAGILRAGYLLQNIDRRLWNPYIGSNIHYKLGNVGIGVENPQYQLEVRGTGFITTLSNENITSLYRVTAGSNIYIGADPNPIINTSLYISATDAIHIPTGTTQQRPRFTDGMVRYNQTTGLYEGTLSNHQWHPLEGIFNCNLNTSITASNDQQIRFNNQNQLKMILNPDGNLGIGTNNPSYKLEVDGSVLIQQDLILQGDLEVALLKADTNLTTQYNLVNDSTIYTSNLFILKSLAFDPATNTLKNNIQLHPVRKSIYIETLNQSNIDITLNGMYEYTSNIYIYMGQTLLSYYSSTIKDYEITMFYDTLNLLTTYHIEIIEPLTIGELVDISIYPVFKAGYEPYDGYMFQQLQTDNVFRLVNSNDIAYTFGNVGIGTNIVTDKLTVAGNIVPSSNSIYSLGCNELRWKDIYLSGNTIDLDGSKLQRNELTGGIEFVYPPSVAAQSNNFVNYMNNVQAEKLGIGTTYARNSLDVIGNVIISGLLGIGTSILSPENRVNMTGDIFTNQLTLSNVSLNQNAVLNITQADTSVNMMECRGVEGLEMTVDTDGNMNIYGDHMHIGEDRSPVFPIHSPIGLENLYTWSGNSPIVNGQEPLVRWLTPSYSNFDRVRIFGLGTQMFTTYYTSPFENAQYSLRFYLTTYESTPGTVTTPTKYAMLSVPVKPNVSNAFFLRSRGYDRWSAILVFVTNKTQSKFYRLQTQTNSYQSIQPNSIWISPNLETSTSHTYHEWMMYSIPKYVIDEYAYDEYYDDKSRYRKNINICVMQGSYINDDYIHCSGFAMRPNPYGLTCHGALQLHWAVNGGSGITWYAANWDYTNLAYFALNTNYNNIRIPICPSNDPLITRLNDFYFVFISWTANSPSWPLTFLYLQNPLNASDVQFIGRPNKSIKGRYGNFLKEVSRDAMGLVVPSPDPKFLVYVGGRPYLNLRIDTTQSGWTTDHSYTVGCFTEEIDPNGRNFNLNYYNSTPVVWN